MRVCLRATGQLSRQVDNLYLLPAGHLPPNPAEFIGGEQMQELLETVTHRFDVILLDTPPLMAASDAAILGPRVDGVLLVVRAGRIERAAGQHAVDQLQKVGAKVLGAVLNDPDSQVPHYGGLQRNYTTRYGTHHKEEASRQWVDGCPADRNAAYARAIASPCIVVLHTQAMHLRGTAAFCSWSCRASSGRAGPTHALGAGVGALVGAGIGALLGYLLPQHRWEYVRF